MRAAKTTDGAGKVPADIEEFFGDCRWWSRPDMFAHRQCAELMREAVAAPRGLVHAQGLCGGTRFVMSGDNFAAAFALTQETLGGLDVFARVQRMKLAVGPSGGAFRYLNAIAPF